MEPFILREGPVAVRPLRPQDAPLLLTWMQNPQVLAFYGGRDMAYTPEKIQEDFYAPEEGARRCLVEFEGAPVGYIQIYQWTPAVPGVPLPLSAGGAPFWHRPVYRGAGAVGQTDRPAVPCAGAAPPHPGGGRRRRHLGPPRQQSPGPALLRGLRLPQGEIPAPARASRGRVEDCWLMEYRPGAPR